MFSVGLDVDTLVSRVMVTLFISLGLYAGNLDYNFGPLSLALFVFYLKVITILAPLQRGLSPGRRLFGKIQNLYSKFYFAISPLLLPTAMAHGMAPTEPSPTPTEAEPLQEPCKGPEKNMSRGPEATPTHILKKGFPNLRDKLISQKAFLHSLALSIHILTNLKFKNEQSAGNSLLRPSSNPSEPTETTERSELSSNFNFFSPWPGTLAEKYHISDHLIKHKKPSFSPGPSGPTLFKNPTPPKKATPPTEATQSKEGARANNVDFGYYLSGLIEGNGLFEDHKLEIKFQEKDISLAYYIKKEIGYGKVIKETNLKPSVGLSVGGAPGPSEGRGVKYVLIHSEGLKKVLNLLNGKLININTINQLLTHKYNTIFNIDILPPAKFDITSNYWLTGFIDAKGNFCINTPPYGLIRHGRARSVGSVGELDVNNSFTLPAEPRPLLKLEQGALLLGKGSSYVGGALAYGDVALAEDEDVVEGHWGLNLEFYIKYPITKGPASAPWHRLPAPCKGPCSPTDGGPL